MATERERFAQWRRPKPDDWVVVRNWDRFQHYKTRDPRWIKNYVALLQDADYLNLTPSERGLLHGIWLAFAQADGQMQARSLQVLVGMRVGTLQLFSLNQAGWIEFSASKPLALARARVETEEEVEIETPLTPLSRMQQQASRETLLLHRAFEIAADWRGGAGEDFAVRLEALEREMGVRLSFSKREQLWDEALRQSRLHRGSTIDP